MIMGHMCNVGKVKRNCNYFDKCNMKLCIATQYYFCENVEYMY